MLTRKALVTGYAGFLGRHLARGLRAEGFQVRVLLHRHTVPQTDFHQEVDDVIWGSIEDEDTIRRAVAGVQVVVHSAWSHTPSLAPRPTVNERAAELIINESVRAGVGWFVFISSVAVYGMRARPDAAGILESSALAEGEERNFIYPAEKIQVEHILRRYQRNGTKLGIFRPGPIFDDRKSPIKKLARMAGRSFAIGFGNGRNRMPYIHASDVVNAVVKWLKNVREDAVFNVTPTQNLRVKDWYRNWGKANGQSVTPLFVRPSVIRLLFLGVKLLKRILGRKSSADVNYALASATRDLIYSNAAIQRQLVWVDEVTARYIKPEFAQPQMTRIAMLSLSYYPNDPRVRRQAETLARDGMAVDILCLRGNGEDRFERFGQISVYRILKGSNKESLLQYLWLSTKFMIAAFLSLNRLHFKRRYRLIQVHNLPDYLVLAAMVQKLLGIPIILDLHDLSVELFESKWPCRVSGILGATLKIIERLSCGLAKQLITTSTGFRNRLLARGIPPEKITLILNTADDRIFKERLPRQFKKIEYGARLLYHGTVAPRFGLTIAIAALAQLQNSIPESTLHIFGKYDPSHRRELEAQIETLGLSDRFFFGAYLSLEEISQIISQSDIGIVPYQSDAFMDLALSTKTFEYVAMRLPVVASRLPSLTAIFDASSLQYFAPGNASDLADKIADFCLHPERRQDFVNRAATVYQQIAWPIMAQRYFNLITTQINGLTRPWKNRQFVY